MNEKTPSEVMYRREFPDQVLDALSSSEPARLIGGNVDGEICDGDKITDVGNLLVKRAVERGDYDMVIYYDTATKNAYFGDEMLRLPKDKLAMSEFFGKLGITIANDDGQGDAVTKLFDDLISKSHDDARADQTFFTVLEKLARGYGGTTFCVIIDNGHKIFPDQTHSHDGAAHATFPDRLKGIVKALKGGTKRHIIVLDNANRVTSDLSAMVPKMNVPSSTRAEMKDILREAIKDEGLLIKAIQFAVTIEVTKVMDLVKSNKNNPNRIIAELLKLRTERIVKMSDGLLSAEIGFSGAEVALSPAVRRFCQTLATNFIKRPGLVDHGVLLMGPPGTGKSVFPSYIAAMCGVPFLKLDALGTSGLSGVSLDRIKKVFDTLEANKPCILFIDEIDKLLPNNEGLRNSNDEQVIGYIQNKLANDAFMKGILVFGATNEPGRLSPAMVRSGRFGKKIAVLPPKTTKEKMAVLKAVWNQLSASGGLNVDGKKISMCDDTLLENIISGLPDHITGGSMKQMLIDAFERVSSGRVPDIWTAFLLLKKKAQEGKYMKKNADFDAAMARALEASDFDLEDDEVGQDLPELSEDELRMLAFARMTADLTEGQKQAQERQKKALEDIHEEVRRVEDLKEQFDSAVGAGMEVIERENADIARRRESLQAEEARITVEMEKVQRSRADLEGNIAKQAAIIERLMGAKIMEIFKTELDYLASSLRYGNTLQTVKVDTLNETELDATLEKIYEILSKILAMRATAFGILKKKELDDLETLFTGYKNTLEFAKGHKGAKGHAGNEWWDGSPYGLDLPALPTVEEKKPQVDPPRNNGRYVDGNSRNGALNTLRSILRTTEAKIVASIIGLSAAAGILYYNRNGIEKALEDEKATIITFESAEESISKGYVVMKDGVTEPVKGYGWAYSPDEIEKFTENDPRRFAVIKVTH